MVTAEFAGTWATSILLRFTFESGKASFATAFPPEVADAILSALRSQERVEPGAPDGMVKCDCGFGPYPHFIPKKEGGGERAEPGRVWCSRCGESVSSPVPKGTVVRAWVECPECIEKAGGERAEPPASLGRSE